MDINATLVGQMISFGVFVWLTMRFIWPPLEKTLNERQEKISTGLAAAERGHQELELAQKYAVQQVQEAKKQAAQTLELARQQADELIAQAKREAQREKQKIIASGHAAIQQERLLAKIELQKEISSLVVNGLENVLGRIITADEQKRLIQKEINHGI